MRGRGFAPALVLGFVIGLLAGCAWQPVPLSEERLRYNELIKTTTEQQLLLNIVRLRYADTPSSLAITNIAAQTELVRSVGLLPFFGVVGNEAQVQSASRVLPMAQIAVTDRPTVSLTPLDDAEFTRKLFTPMTMEGVLYLARATWPISTVFRLWLENLNWVPNAETASGPITRRPPDYARFLSGIEALQSLQDRGMVVFTAEERDERIGGAVPAASIRPGHLVSAAREGLEFKPDEGGTTWSLVRKRLQPVLRLHPDALQSPEMMAFTEAFRIVRNRHSFDIDIARLDPFPAGYPPQGVDRVDLETRSLLQVLYFMSKGVDVPEGHLTQGVVVPTIEDGGRRFDWRQVLKGLFHVNVIAGRSPPPHAHVAIRYLDHWYYIDRRDADSMSTFSLVLELSRLELGTGARTAGAPTLTLPLR
ncbi:MAG TPA: hypothetical protein PKA20_25880 [Burkholderiaceae bacterium]|nr:hypothetical protein [Burkholderiaceae bacterium]